MSVDIFCDQHAEQLQKNWQLIGRSNRDYINDKAITLLLFVGLTMQRTECTSSFILTWTGTNPVRAFEACNFSKISIHLKLYLIGGRAEKSGLRFGDYKFLTKICSKECVNRDKFQNSKKLVFPSIWCFPMYFSGQLFKVQVI